MLVIDPAEFQKACEALVTAARRAKDQQGLRVVTDIPRSASPEPLDRPGTSSSDVFALRDTLDWQRIRAITLGAIIALCNGAAVPGDEVHLTGFAKPETAE